MADDYKDFIEKLPTRRSIENGINPQGLNTTRRMTKNELTLNQLRPTYQKLIGENSKVFSEDQKIMEGLIQHRNIFKHRFITTIYMIGTTNKGVSGELGQASYKGCLPEEILIAETIIQPPKTYHSPQTEMTQDYINVEHALNGQYGGIKLFNNKVNTTEQCTITHIEYTTNFA